MASTVTERGWQTFKLAMSGAARILDENRSRLADNPERFAQRIAVATYLGESDASMQALFDKGRRREATYLPLYSAMETHLSPLRGGSNRALMAFINEAGRASPVAESEGMYARMVWLGTELYSRIELDPALDWKAKRAGIEGSNSCRRSTRNRRGRYWGRTCRCSAVAMNGLRASSRRSSCAMRAPARCARSDEVAAP